jgi:hypothetical protein
MHKVHVNARKKKKSRHSSAQRDIFPCGEGINRCLRQPEGVGM